ncbi:MAG: prepilin peptidase [Epulopiscium sp.]|nr:prepilin peptidase [Candidatus Epulonipiscium sp.]
MVKGVILLFGILIGSFFNVCIYRIPRGESIVFPSSHCPSCKTPLGPKDLIPIVSYLIKKGKCSYCGQRISLRYPFIEGLTGLTYMLLYDSLGFSFSFLFSLFFVSLLIIITGIDYDHQIIPDLLVLWGIGGGVLYRLIEGILENTAIGMVEGILGMVLGGGVLLLIAFLSKGGMGGGDIKLLGMIGLWLGWKLTIVTLFLSFFLGGFISIFLLLFRIKSRKDPIPFGPFICLGAYLSYLWGNALLQAYFQLFL